MAETLKERLTRAAKWYDNAGCALVPLRDKRPLTDDWSTNPPGLDTVLQFITDGRANGVGVITGRLSRNLVVLDFDGEDWGRAYDHMRVLYAALGETYVVETGSGKRHLWIQCPDLPEDFTRRQFWHGELDAGIDLRGNRHQVAVPPSMHPSGKPYKRVNDPSEIRKMRFPDLLAALEDWGEAAPEEGRSEPVPDRIPVGKRDDTLASVAGAMRRKGLKAGEILPALQELAKRCEQPPGNEITDDDLKRISKSVERYDPEDVPWRLTRPETAADAVKLPTDWPIMEASSYFEPREPIEYVVSELLPMGSLAILYGAPGAFKSLLAADLMASVATGKPWLPPPPKLQSPPGRQTTLVPCLWLDFDNGLRRTSGRLEAVLRARGVKPDAPNPELRPAAIHLLSVVMPMPWLDASDESHIMALADLLNARYVGLVVVDNLGVVAGQADENTAEMVRVLKHFRWVAETTGAAVLLIHHQRKATGFKTRAGERLRGHSGIEAALDVALLIERDPTDRSRVVIQGTKTRDLDVAPFAAQFSYQHRETSDELLEARFWGLPYADDSKSGLCRQAILDAVADLEIPQQKAIVAFVKSRHEKMGVLYIRDMLALLIAEETLIMKRGQFNRKLYRYPTPGETIPD